MTSSSTLRVEAALAQVRAGGSVLILDDESRENEGDIVVAAQFATPQAINFMARHGRGLICLALAPEQVERLGLPPMTSDNRANRSTAFTVSIEAREGIDTGISAHDRAHTIRLAADPEVDPRAIVSPGHVFPLRAAEGGVMARDGHTEGSVDLMRLAGLTPAAAICEVMSEDGTMARRAELDAFAKTHNLPVLSIADIRAYRLAREIMVEKVGTSLLPTAHAREPFVVHAFRNRIDGTEHLVIMSAEQPETPLVRVHSECLTGDALGSLRCDCGAQLQESLKRIGEEGGAVVYLRGQEGRGIGLANKILAYGLQDQGLDTVDANAALGLPVDAREYWVAAHILKALEIDRFALLSNNPAKRDALESLGLTVAEQRPLLVGANPHSAHYLATKAEKLGHAIPIQGTAGPQQVAC